MTAPYTAYEHLSVPVAVLRKDLCVYANQALAGLFGVDRGQLIGSAATTWIDAHVPTTDADPLHAAHSRAVAGSHWPPTIWMRLKQATGLVRSVVVRASPGPAEDEWTFVVVDIDLDTHRLSDALANAAIELVKCRDEQDVYETAAQLLHEHGFTCAFLLPDGDEQLRHGPLRVNVEAELAAEKLTGKKLSEWRFPLEKVPHFREMLRTHRAAFVDDLFVIVEKIHPPAVMDILRTYLPRARAVEAPVVVEGAPIAILSLQSPTLTSASTSTFELFVRCVGSAVENVRHHQKMAASLEQLKRLQRELLQKERLTALGEAAKVVSHEVRNPIGAIINAVSVLKKSTRTDPNVNLLGMIEEEALRLDGLVRDLLELARPLDPRPIPVSTEELSEKVNAFVFGRDQGKRLKVSVDAGEVQVVHADPPLIHLALENLLRNAIQASPPQGEIRVTIADRSAATLVAVDDQGPGVRPDEEHRIFEPFYTTRAKGTGLGLAVVKRVAEVHGAQLRVTKSALGGARFELEFPRVEVSSS